MSSLLVVPPILSHQHISINNVELIVSAIKAVAWSAVIATIAVSYAEIMYRTTTNLYKRGILLRYGPLPTDRNMLSNWLNAFGFTLPSMLYGYLCSPTAWHWSKPSFWQLYIYTAAYMLMHDTIFYLLHRSFHASKSLYKLLHEKHHEYSKAMNVFVVGFAEVTENLCQVGVPWLIWTVLAGRSGDILLVTIPMSVTIFTTLLGHGGMKMHPYLFIFHPWAVIMLLPISKYVLTPGDHQMHHVYRRCNMGLFFRFWDKLGGTYRRSVLASHDVKWWREELRGKARPTDRSKVAYDLVEVHFGF